MTKPLRISPSALKAYLACPRQYWLQSIARVPREQPTYLLGGQALDAAVQHYLTPEPPGGNGGAPEPYGTSDAELAKLRQWLPEPGTVLVQPELQVEEGSFLWYGKLDWLDERLPDVTVINDLKRVYALKATMTTEQLENDIQAQMYAWLVWRTRDTTGRSVMGRWTYYVRESKRVYPITCVFDRVAVEAWFDTVARPAAQQMLALRDAKDALELEHDPDSCEQGTRCFVRAHCPILQGPIKGATDVNLDQFIVNPPKSAQAPTANETPVQESDVLEVSTVEGSPEALALLQAEPEPERKPRTRKPRAAKAEPAPEPAPEPLVALESATTEEILDELADRGYSVTLERA